LRPGQDGAAAVALCDLYQRVGRIADRTGKRDLVLYVCSVRAVASALLLRGVSIAVWLSLAFGLIGMASAGVIMTAAPPIAGWLYDRSGDP
jgi:hypothetical protein